MQNEKNPVMLDVAEEGIRLSNRSVTLFFDTHLGVLMLTSSEEKTMCFSRAYVQVQTEKQVFDSRKMVYKGINTLDFENKHGKGKAVVIRLEDPERIGEIHLKLSMVEDQRGYSTVVQFKNREEENVSIISIDPFILDIDDSSRIYTDWAEDNLRYFKNGFHSWELSQAKSLAQGENLSHMFSVIQNITTRNSMLLGFVTATDYLTTIAFYGREESENRLAQMVASSMTDRYAVPKGKTLMSEELLVLVDNNPNPLMERYVDIVAERMDALEWHNIPTGWCSWYFYYTMPDEREILDNTEFLVDRFPNIEWIQIDDGFQRTVGDWEVNDRFSKGLVDLVKKIKQSGFRAGIWTAPFVASEHSELFKDKPDWFVRDGDNKPIAVDNNPLWLGNYYALDLSNPKVIEFIEDLFETLKKEGFEYFKIDFLYHAAVEGIRYDNQIPRGAVVRRGLEAIRRAVGDSLVLGCGAPLGQSIGFVNMMRIGTDIAPAWRYEWGGGVYECSINTMSRAVFHNRWWINDPDCVLVRQNDTELTLDEIRLWISIVGLSGGAVLLSDRMMEVNEERLALIDKLLPVFRKGAIAIDALHEAEPRLFALSIDSIIGQWSVVAFVNLTESPIDITVNLEELGMETLPHHVFDFWKEEYEGMVEDIVNLKKIPRHSCKLLLFKPESKVPCVLSTSMHITQGAIELKEQNWDHTNNELSVVVKRNTKSPEKVFFVFDSTWRPIGGLINNQHIDLVKVAPEVVAIESIFHDGQELRVCFERVS